MRPSLKEPCGSNSVVKFNQQPNILQIFFMKSQVHKIQRLFVDVEFNGTESDGMNLQRSASDLYDHFIMPALEKALNQYVPIKDYLTLERLDIDAGTLQLDRLESNLSERIIHALEKSLQELSVSTSPLHSRETDTVTFKTEGESISDAFIFFLKKGTLPWSFHLPSGSNFEESVYKFLKEPKRFGSTPELIRREVVDTLTSATARKRLVHQFTPVFLETLLELISAEDKKVLEGILQLFRSSEFLSLDAKQLQPLLWEHAFASLASGSPLAEQTILTKIRSALSDSVFRNSSLAKQIKSVLFDEKKTDTSTNKLSASLLVEQNVQMTDDSDSQSPVEHPDAKAGIYIGLAGLVLLHPFLPQLFRALGIADDETLLQPNKALYLLFFLATGECIAPEYELVLSKILCNISLDTVVESDIILSVEEQQEAEALLSAVIRHWEVLQNTGIEGLRETFLKRSGKLSQKSDGEWLLQVESKSYDLLLEQLPWGISMIKLPWMSQMLRVEWV